jgi:two-component system, NtrC family, nitrogen regulation sensor histidine kinase NtrY
MRLGFRQEHSPVTFRVKLFVIFTIALLVSVGLLAVGVTALSRRTFERRNHQFSDAAVEQLSREFGRREMDVVHQVKGIADAESTVRMAIDLSRPQPDAGIYANDARAVAQSHQLDFLDFVGSDGSIISSVEWPGKSGSKLAWVTEPMDWPSLGSFLMKVETASGPFLGLTAVATVRVGDKNLYVVGGQRLGTNFLASLVLPLGMRAMLYQSLSPTFKPSYLIESSGAVAQADRFAAVFEKERQQPGEQRFQIAWTKNLASVDEYRASPLLGRQKELLGMLLVSNSRADAVTLERRIRLLALGAGAVGVLLGVLVSWWAAWGVTRPVTDLTQGTRELTAGNWNTRVPIRGASEIADMARAFNQMTQHLGEQRQRIVQAERVSAWREMAFRLAHELKNPLVSLQLAIGKLGLPGNHDPAQLEKAFRDSAESLASENQTLNAIVKRFSDFATLSQPVFAPVNVNDIVKTVLKLFAPEFSSVGRPPINPEVHLDEELSLIQADSTLLRCALENLVLNAMDAMPAGGVLMIRTQQEDNAVQLEVSDTGTGLPSEEAERMFTPYCAAKQHDSGLGLAIVQSVVSNHAGRVTVESESGVGTSFYIVLPITQSIQPARPTTIA